MSSCSNRPKILFCCILMHSAPSNVTLWWWCALIEFNLNLLLLNMVCASLDAIALSCVTGSDDGGWVVALKCSPLHWLWRVGWPLPIIINFLVVDVIFIIMWQLLPSPSLPFWLFCIWWQVTLFVLYWENEKLKPYLYFLLHKAQALITPIVILVLNVSRYLRKYKNTQYCGFHSQKVELQWALLAGGGDAFLYEQSAGRQQQQVGIRDLSFYDSTTSVKI